MKTVLCGRVSTAEQTIAHQRAHAETAGFRIDEVVSDDGVSDGCAWHSATTQSTMLQVEPNRPGFELPLSRIVTASSNDP